MHFILVKLDKRRWTPAMDNMPTKTRKGHRRVVPKAPARINIVVTPADEHSETDDELQTNPDMEYTPSDDEKEHKQESSPSYCGLEQNWTRPRRGPEPTPPPSNLYREARDRYTAAIHEITPQSELLETLLEQCLRDINNAETLPMLHAQIECVNEIQTKIKSLNIGFYKRKIDFDELIFFIQSASQQIQEDKADIEKSYQKREKIRKHDDAEKELYQRRLQRIDERLDELRQWQTDLQNKCDGSAHEQKLKRAMERKLNSFERDYAQWTEDDVLSWVQLVEGCRFEDFDGGALWRNDDDPNAVITLDMLLSRLDENKFARLHFHVRRVKTQNGRRG